MVSKHARKNSYVLEGGLTDRQKDVCRKLVAEIVAEILFSEALEDNGILTYESLYDLTQADKFVKWQENTLSRPTDATHPGDTVAKLLVQLERTDMAVQALGGLLSTLKRQVQFAQDNVKNVMSMIIHAYEGDVGLVEVTDKDKVQWQIYTQPQTPDSVVLRRTPITKRRPDGAPKKRTKSSKRSRKPKPKSQ